MDMLTTESNLSAVKQTVGTRASAGADVRQLKVLCERLLRVQPQSEPLLKRLLAQSCHLGDPRAFAPIQDGRCSACNMRIAIARVQQAKVSTFINCANCMRFLYFVP